MIVTEAETVISSARGCSPDAAFDELIDVAMHYHVSIRCAAESLLSLVGARGGDAPGIAPPQWISWTRASEESRRTVGAA